jgi:hypothetical protein
LFSTVGDRPIASPFAVCAVDGRERISSVNVEHERRRLTLHQIDRYDHR